jgi:phosphate transport system permease protein
MQTAHHERASAANRPRWDSLVWLCGAGLATAVLMVLILLGLILHQGLRVFWPDPVAEITLQPDATSRIGDSPVLAGPIVEKRRSVKRGVVEWQLFTGNKDAYGAMFRHLDADDVLRVEFPRSIAVAERVAFGKAIFHPVALTTPEGQRIEAADAGFWQALDQAVAEVRQRYREIAQLERSGIGPINREVSALRQKRRQLEQRADPAAREMEQTGERLAVLEERFQALAAEARRLRGQLSEGSLEYRLPTGQLRSQPLGEFLDIYRPNAMRLPAKVVFFARQIWSFLSERPREANTEGGIFPAIFGTFVMTLLMSVAVMPFGVMAAIHLREYARQGPMVQAVRIAVNNLAGVPSIVYGVFGLGFFVYFVGGGIDQLLFPERLPAATFGTGGILWASLTLALMTVPVVIVATEEALAAVPRGVREASLACGASKWQTIQRIVLPASAPGILTGLILAMARGAGEVAPLMLVGVVKLAPSLPLDGEFPFIHLDRKFMHLGYHIYDLGFQSPDSEAARPMVFATSLLLILLVISLNLGAILIRNSLRRRYRSAQF